MLTAEELLEQLKAWFWEQDGFAGEVFAFAEENDEFFQAAKHYFDSGGDEQPLDWTALHQRFVKQFEGRLQDFLAERSTDLEGFRNALAAAEGAGGDREMDIMVDVMLSMADYQPWLKSMLALAEERLREVAENAAAQVETASEGTDCRCDDLDAFR